jgi:hypothetical protein
MGHLDVDMTIEPDNEKKIADLLMQLKKAGATVTVAETTDERKTTEELRRGSQLSDETINAIATRARPDFGAWVAWTLRF